MRKKKTESAWIWTKASWIVRIIVDFKNNITYTFWRFRSCLESKALPLRHTPKILNRKCLFQIIRKLITLAVSIHRLNFISRNSLTCKWRILSAWLPEPLVSHLLSPLELCDEAETLRTHINETGSASIICECLWDRLQFVPNTRKQTHIFSAPWLLLNLWFYSLLPTLKGLVAMSRVITSLRRLRTCGLPTKKLWQSALLVSLRFPRASRCNIAVQQTLLWIAPDPGPLWPILLELTVIRCLIFNRSMHTRRAGSPPPNTNI
jgi:hypothetical protein